MIEINNMIGDGAVKRATIISVTEKGSLEESNNPLRDYIQVRAQNCTIDEFMSLFLASEIGSNFLYGGVDTFIDLGSPGTIDLEVGTVIEVPFDASKNE